METEQKSNGALVGLIIIVIILIVGGIYFWKNSMKENPAPVGASSDTAKLDANVNSVDLNNIDNGI